MKNLTAIEVQTIESLKEIIAESGKISTLLMDIHNLVVHHVEFCSYSEDDRNNLYTLCCVANAFKPLENYISLLSELKELTDLKKLIIEKDHRISELERQVNECPK